jgi:hypothetical protein
MFWTERRRRRILDRAAAADAAEHLAAIARLRQVANGHPTVVLPRIEPAQPQRAPLLTRGQAFRSRRTQ